MPSMPRANAMGAPRRATELSPLGERAVRKARARILPIILVLYFIAYLDRNNVAFVADELSRDIGLTSAAFGLGAGLFFLGYTLFEVPSNAGMYRFGARKWFSRILIPWGILAVGMSLVQDPAGFAVVRTLLGAAEAGFFPAVLFYFTLWFPAAQRVAVLSAFIVAQPIANAIGAPLSGLILTMDGLAGLHGWQWVFILQGAPAIIMGVLTPFLITDRPADATWLSRDEREWLGSTMSAELDAGKSTGAQSFLAGLRDRRTLVYACLNFGMVCGIYGLGLWLPSIVATLGVFSSVELGLIVMIPHAVAACTVYWWGRRADRTGKRAWHASVALIVGAIGLLGAGLCLPVNPVLSLGLLTVAAIGNYSAIAPMLSMPAAALTGAAAAAGIGLVNAIGNVGGFASPLIVGLINDASGTRESGLVFLAGCLAVTAVVTALYAGRRPEGDATLSPGLDAAQSKGRQK